MIPFSVDTLVPRGPRKHGQSLPDSAECPQPTTLAKKTIMSIRMILVLVISSGDATSVYGNKRRGLMPTFAFFFAFLAALRETWFDVRHRICNRTETFRPRPALAAHD